MCIRDRIKVQQKMLERCSHWLTNNGFLIYSVCSLLKEEGENQIEKFLRKNKMFSAVHSVKNYKSKQDGLEIHKDRGMRIMPFYEENIGGTEGFYVAYLQVKERK